MRSTRCCGRRGARRTSTCSTTPAKRWRLDLGGERLDAHLLGERWRLELTSAEAISEALPVEAVGACVVSADGELFRGDLEALRAALASGRLRYHHGAIGGAWPSFPSA